MRAYITLLIAMVSITLFGQTTDYNLKKGYVAEGYDVVSYFDGQAEEGNKKFERIYEGVTYKFVSQENLDRFNRSPESFIPQYGGYCAYAVGANGKKVGINPETYEIRDGKLYLFYNAWGTNTLDKWNEEGPQQLQAKADTNWKRIGFKKN